MTSFPPPVPRVAPSVAGAANRHVHGSVPPSVVRWFRWSGAYITFDDNLRPPIRGPAHAGSVGVSVAIGLEARVWAAADLLGRDGDRNKPLTCANNQRRLPRAARRARFANVAELRNKQLRQPLVSSTVIPQKTLLNSPDGRICGQVHEVRSFDRDGVSPTNGPGQPSGAAEAGLSRAEEDRLRGVSLWANPEGNTRFSFPGRAGRVTSPAAGGIRVTVPPSPSSPLSEKHV